MERNTSDRQLGQARQTECSVWGQVIRETSAILSDNPIGARGTGNRDGWRERGRGKRTEWDSSRGRQKDMEECNYRSKPKTCWSAKSAPLSPRLNHKPEDSSGWLAWCGLHPHQDKRKVLGFAPWLMIPRHWSDQFSGTHCNKTILRITTQMWVDL